MKSYPIKVFSHRFLKLNNWMSGSVLKFHDFAKCVTVSGAGPRCHQTGNKHQQKKAHFYFLLVILVKFWILLGLML